MHWKPWQFHGPPRTDRFSMLAWLGLAKSSRYRWLKRQTEGRSGDGRGLRIALEQAGV